MMINVKDIKKENILVVNGIGFVNLPDVQDTKIVGIVYETNNELKMIVSTKKAIMDAVNTLKNYKMKVNWDD